MSNNLQEQFEQYLQSQSSKLPKAKSTKNTIIAYSMIGIGIVMCIFLVVEVTGSPKTKEPINGQELLEQKAAEQASIIQQAEKAKAVAELRKQATELDLQALSIEQNGTLEN